MTQRVPSDPHWRVNCTAYCAAMLINDSTLGGLYGVTGQAVRARSDEPNPDPGSPGLNIRQIVEVAGTFNVSLDDKTGEAWPTMMLGLKRGHRVLLQVDYASLGTFRCQAGGDFGHALVLVQTTKGFVQVSDPLCKVTKWIPENIVRHAGEVFARESGVMSGTRHAICRAVPKVG
jgi:hypothetical protein